MKKLYRTIILLTVLIFLTTYSPNEFNVFPKKKNFFFKIKNIKIVNNYLIDESKIIKKLTQINEKNILFIKRNDIEKPLKSIEFLEKIEVKKKYPNTIIIKVYETKPLAILFKKNDKFLLDSSSNLITFNKNMIVGNLPNVFGEGAELEFINFFNQLENNNFPRQRVKNLYYFQIGRWDLQLLNNQIIKFPTSKTTEAIKQSVELLNRKDFENYNIIDLRIYGKIVVE